MLTGKLIQLVHLTHSTYSPTTRLIADRNEKGYGVIEGADGKDVYFSHEVVESRFGFDDLRKGQILEYTLESAPYLRASAVRLATGDAGPNHSTVAL
jgi:cold shock CspA family protein